MLEFSSTRTYSHINLFFPSLLAITTLVLVALFGCYGCDKVEHSEERNAVGSLVLRKACTIRSPRLGMHASQDIHCATDLLGVDGHSILQGSLYTATVDPQARYVVATSAIGRHAWLYDAKTGVLLGEQDLAHASAYPKWSPDGTIITAHGLFSRGLYITSVPFEGKSVKVDDRYESSGIAWSPDSRKLAYILGASNPGGHGSAELWVWERMSGLTSFVVKRSFVSWTESTSWAVWIGNEPHLCSNYFIEPDADCATRRGWCCSGS
jgi:hypothetical protein